MYELCLSCLTLFYHLVCASIIVSSLKMEEALEQHKPASCRTHPKRCVLWLSPHETCDSQSPSELRSSVCHVQQEMESFDLRKDMHHTGCTCLSIATIAVFHFQQERLLVPVFGHDLACQEVPVLSDSSFEISKLHLPLPESYIWIMNDSNLVSMPFSILLGRRNSETQD